MNENRCDLPARSDGLRSFSSQHIAATTTTTCATNVVCRAVQRPANNRSRGRALVPPRRAHYSANVRGFCRKRRGASGRDGTTTARQRRRHTTSGSSDCDLNAQWSAAARRPVFVQPIWLVTPVEWIAHSNFTKLWRPIDRDPPSRIIHQTNALQNMLVKYVTNDKNITRLK